MRSHISISGWLLALTLLTTACEEKAGSPTVQPPAISAAEPPPEAPARGENRPRTVYVPAYSHLRTAKDRDELFSITLSVRNVDPASSITLSHVDYFDTSGHRVRRYLAKPQRLRPLETAEFFVETSDSAGGSGANFLVYWEGPSDAHPLLTEAVMVGFSGGSYNTFASRGVELAKRPTIPATTDDAPDEPAPAP